MDSDSLGEPESETGKLGGWTNGKLSVADRCQIVRTASGLKVIHQAGQLNVVTFGNGASYMMLFHGFGQDASFWKPLIEPFEDAYTFIVVDLFFHGQSTWSEKVEVLSPSIWQQMTRQLLDHLNVRKLTIGGFSIGCKFALSAFEASPERVEKLILVAPDGLVSRFWYQLATSTHIARTWFRRLVMKPGVFFGIANLLHSIKVLDRSTLTFVANQMNTRIKRLRVYKSWTVFRHLNVNPHQVATLLNTHQIPLQVFVGRWDRIIRRKHVAPILAKTKKCQIDELDAGHHNLLQKVALYYQKRTSVAA